jgi:hypothetical protein
VEVHARDSLTGHCNGVLMYVNLHVVMKLGNVAISYAFWIFFGPYHCFCWRHWLISKVLVLVRYGRLDFCFLWTSI